jgi:hypothetical protein
MHVLVAATHRAGHFGPAVRYPTLSERFRCGILVLSLALCLCEQEHDPRHHGRLLVVRGERRPRCRRAYPLRLRWEGPARRPVGGGSACSVARREHLVGGCIQTPRMGVEWWGSWPCGRNSHLRSDCHRRRLASRGGKRGLPVLTVGGQTCVGPTAPISSTRERRRDARSRATSPSLVSWVSGGLGAAGARRALIPSDPGAGHGVSRRARLTRTAYGG